MVAGNELDRLDPLRVLHAVDAGHDRPHRRAVRLAAAARRSCPTRAACRDRAPPPRECCRCSCRPQIHTRSTAVRSTPPARSSTSRSRTPVQRALPIARAGTPLLMQPSVTAASIAGMARRSSSVSERDRPTRPLISSDQRLASTDRVEELVLGDDVEKIRVGEGGREAGRPRDVARGHPGIAEVAIGAKGRGAGSENRQRLSSLHHGGLGIGSGPRECTSDARDPPSPRPAPVPIP